MQDDLDHVESIRLDFSLHAVDVLAVVADVMDVSGGGTVDLRPVRSVEHHWCAIHIEAFALLLAGAYAKAKLTGHDVRQDAPRIVDSLLRADVE